MRSHLFEFEDLSWFPDTIRRSMVDYLSFFLRTVRYYKPVVPLLVETLQHTGQTSIVDLCSGGGGPIKQIDKDIRELLNKPVDITLTDKFPNTEAYQELQAGGNIHIHFESESVDATNVPPSLKGLRTCFSALHHFSPCGVRLILQDAIANRAPIAIFDGGDKNLITILGIILAHPVIFLFCTPFLRPFRLSRIVFTYLIPLIPFCTVWDGVVSITRLHRPSTLNRLIGEIDHGAYSWQTGIRRHPLGFGISYLIGIPKQS